MLNSNNKIIILCTVLVVSVGLFRIFYENKQSKAGDEISTLRVLENRAIFEMIPNIRLTKMDYSSTEIYSILSDYNLILRIPLHSCSACVETEIHRIEEELPSEQVARVIIIATYESFREYYVNFSSLVDLHSFHSTDGFISSIEELAIPYYLVLDKNGRIFNTLIVTEANATRIGYLINRTLQ